MGHIGLTMESSLDQHRPLLPFPPSSWSPVIAPPRFQPPSISIRIHLYALRNHRTHQRCSSLFGSTSARFLALPPSSHNSFLFPLLTVPYDHLAFQKYSQPYIPFVSYHHQSRLFRCLSFCHWLGRHEDDFCEIPTPRRPDDVSNECY